MAETFGDVYRRVQAHCGLVDLTLARTWVQWAYEEVLKRRAVWSHLRVDWNFSTLTASTGTCGVVRASATVSGGTLVFTAADVGRQFRVANVPIYTIIAVDTTGGTTATLDRTYSDATDAAATGLVLDAYITVPLNFKRWVAVADPTSRMRLRFFGVTQEKLNQRDPVRQTVGGDPRVLVATTYSPVPANAGQARFELWPYCTSARTFYAMYLRKSAILDDADILEGAFADGGLQVLADGALSRLALWPGMEGRKNPYFNLPLAQAHETKFRDGAQLMETQDEDLYPTWLSDPAYNEATIPWDSNFLQSHDGSLPDVSLGL